MAESLTVEQQAQLVANLKAAASSHLAQAGEASLHAGAASLIEQLQRELAEARQIYSSCFAKLDAAEQALKGKK